MLLAQFVPAVLHVPVAGPFHVSVVADAIRFCTRLTAAAAASDSGMTRFHAPEVFRFRRIDCRFCVFFIFLSRPQNPVQRKNRLPPVLTSDKDTVLIWRVNKNRHYFF